MANPYIGEIRMFGGNFEPVGWMFCDGQLLAISENDTLFNLIGTTYGGDGESTFGLPDLRGRLPLHHGSGPGLSTYGLGEQVGVEQTALTTQQIPVHTHPQLANGAPATDNSPGGKLLAQASTADIYITGNPTVALQNTAITPTGGSQPHSNLQPYLCVSFIISLFGIFPTHEPLTDGQGGLMTDPFVAEIRIFPFNFAPTGWAVCDGQLLPISQNTALFSLLGTMYGGNGMTTFALPDLQGRVATHQGQGPGLGLYEVGQTGGEDYVTLLESEIPMHAHVLNASSGATDEEGTKNPLNAAPGDVQSSARLYGSLSSNAVTLDPNALAPAGASAPHNNLMPYLTLRYCIAMQGVFPPRT